MSLPPPRVRRPDRARLEFVREALLALFRGGFVMVDAKPEERREFMRAAVEQANLAWELLLEAERAEFPLKAFQATSVKATPKGKRTPGPLADDYSED